jgi:tetratricopeptide (TPR) repeat protein
MAPSPGAMHLLSVGTLERVGIWSILPGYAATIGLAVLCACSLRSRPAAAFFGVFLLATLLPVCNLIPLPSLVVAPYRVGLCGPAAAALLASVFAHGYRSAALKLRVSRLAAGGRHSAEYRSDRSDRSDPTDHANPLPALRGACNAGVLARLRLAAGAAVLLWFGVLTVWGSAQWQSERTIFSTIVRYYPDSIVGRFNLTSAMLRLHESRPALVELDSLLTRIFRSRAWTQKDTALAALRNDRGILVRILENQGNAIQPEGWLASLYGQRGFALLDSQQRDEARNSFSIGVAIDRRNDDANLGMAQMAYDAGDMRASEGYLYVALAARPERAELHMLLAHTLAALGRSRQAENELATWSSLQPWSGQAFVELAEAKSRRGDYAGARASLEYALAHSICNPAEVRARLNDLRDRTAQFIN